MWYSLHSLYQDEVPALLLSSSHYGLSEAWHEALPYARM